MNSTDLAQVFARIPPLEDYAVEDFAVTPLPGYTNRNFRLHNHEIDWVLRIPRSETGRFIDRNAEAHNQTLAHELEIAPQVLWRDDYGLSLTPTLGSSRTIQPADFSDETVLQLILEPIRKLHCSAIEFDGVVNLENLLTRYYSMLNESRQQAFAERFQQAQSTLRSLVAEEGRYVASHNDLVLENVLFEPGRVWLIDWEFSAMASPYWDLATVCNAARLDPEQTQHLLELYCCGNKKLDKSILLDFRQMLQLLSDCWMAAVTVT